jgi:Na+/H+ antiporter NhaD/arsenite permease-like protein
MLLVRPYLRADRLCTATRHLPSFFIFIVSGAGGLLTPLGDPLGFRGFLRGVPFTGTLHLVPAWLAVKGLLRATLCALDPPGGRGRR